MLKSVNYCVEFPNLAVRGYLVMSNGQDCC